MGVMMQDFDRWTTNDESFEMIEFALLIEQCLRMETELVFELQINDSVLLEY